MDHKRKQKDTRKGLLEKGVCMTEVRWEEGRRGVERSQNTIEYMYEIVKSTVNKTGLSVCTNAIFQ